LNHAPVKKDSTKSNDFCIGSTVGKRVRHFSGIGNFKGNVWSTINQMLLCGAVNRHKRYRLDWKPSAICEKTDVTIKHNNWTFLLSNVAA